MTSLLSKRVGIDGQVIAFEPHPEIFQQLASNVQLWPGRRIELSNRAVSCRQGSARIRETECFELNEGTARLARDGNAGKSFEVLTVRLDDVLPKTAIGMLKIDVEGHEFEVLSGAAGLLAAGSVRDILFESNWDFPGRAHELLERNGYQLFDLRASSFGVRLAKPSRRADSRRKMCDYLATLVPERAWCLVRPRGWRVLGGDVY
jgi:FkbM family methyltransferase